MSASNGNGTRPDRFEAVEPSSSNGPTATAGRGSAATTRRRT